MDTAPLISNPLKDKINKNSKILLVTPKNLPNLYNDITEFYKNANIQIVTDQKDKHVYIAFNKPIGIVSVKNKYHSYLSST